ncbi:MAG: hypothetical protein ACXQTI_02760 [Candidatus Nezhaarchaeales archaeon]
MLGSVISPQATSKEARNYFDGQVMKNKMTQAQADKAFQAWTKRKEEFKAKKNKGLMD